MAKGDSSKTTGTTPSWQSGSLTTDPISAEGLNSALRSDISASYLKGPTQTGYVGMGQGSRDAMDNLYARADANRGLLTPALNYNQSVIGQGGLTGEQRNAIAGINDVVGGYKGILSQGGLTTGQRDAMSGIQEARGLYRDMYDRGGAGNPFLNDIIRQTNDNTYADMMASLGATGGIGSNIQMKELGGALADNESRLRYQDFGDSFMRQGNALAGMTGADSSLFNMGQTGQGNVANALAGIQGARTGVFNMEQAGAGNAANAAGAMPGLLEQYMSPERIAVAQQGAMDADKQAQAAFDPALNHLLNYQGLLGQNSGAPQPAAPFGWRDAAGLGLGLLSAFL